MEFLQSVLSDQAADIKDKIQAAKALDAIERRTEGGLSGEAVSSMSVSEINAEIARIKALIDGQAVEKA